MDSIHEDVTRHLNGVTLQGWSAHPVSLKGPPENRHLESFVKRLVNPITPSHERDKSLLPGTIDRLLHWAPVLSQKSP